MKRFLIILVVIVFTSIQKSEAQDMDTLHIVNLLINYDSKDLKYNIQYDLDESPDRDYQVSLYLKYYKKDQSKPAIIELKNATGDIGIGNFAGKNRKIIWDPIKDYELLEGINEEAYQEFDVVAEVYSKSLKIVKAELDNADRKYNILYDLEGQIDMEYKVQLFFQFNQERLINKKLKQVSGDAGIGYFAGRNRRIIWDWTKEVDLLKESNENMDDLDGSFKIIVEPVKIKRDVITESSSSIYYWLGGGAAILGGGAYLLLSKKSSSSAVSTDLPAPNGFGRPGNQ